MFSFFLSTIPASCYHVAGQQVGVPYTTARLQHKAHTATHFVCGASEKEDSSKLKVGVNIQNIVLPLIQAGHSLSNTNFTEPVHTLMVQSSSHGPGLFEVALTQASA